jgi:hypothetical protein
VRAFLDFLVEQYGNTPCRQAQPHDR